MRYYESGMTLTEQPQHSISEEKYAWNTSKNMSDEALKAAKIQRRAAKVSLTRLVKALTHLCESKRPANEVSKYLVKVKDAFENVVSKHETYANLIVNDDLFENEEKWLDDCQNYF